jgi:hypothetical protein
VFVQVAPFKQTFSFRAHSSTSSWQYLPVQFGGHLQVYEFIPSRQRPPFWQRWLYNPLGSMQSSLFIWHLSPVKPESNIRNIIIQCGIFCTTTTFLIIEIKLLIL